MIFVTPFRRGPEPGRRKAFPAHESPLYWVAPDQVPGDFSRMRLRERVARNLRRLRQEKSLSQEELADRADINRNYVGMLEREENAASVDMLEKLAAVLEIDPVSMTVTAEVGINTQHLEWEVEKAGYSTMHFPASIACATLGGFIAHRGTGVLSTKYGKIEDMIMSLEVVTPTGEIINTLPVPHHGIRLLIGPEGGLSSDEIAQAREQGFADMLLGPRVLRTETAGLTAITALQCRFGDLA